jgi:Sec23/Sec24 beta-sandwich domain
VFEVACRLRASTGVTIGNYYTPAGIEFGVDFTTGSMNADTTFAVELETGNQTTNPIFLQLVCLFTDMYGFRKLRVINMSLDVVDHVNNYYGSLDYEALFYLMARKSID